MRCLNSSSNRHTNLKQIEITAMLVYSFSALIETAMRVEPRPSKQHVIVCDNVLSSKHMLKEIMVVFHLLFRGRLKVKPVFMHAHVDEA